ncbi:phosphopentomutase [Dielma fastidiosa]|uniref:Phosphopentomutase n=1 Tax=Dielma fastidiosa TaxID=1034346 RepID=A0A318KQ55_9FIRM|nr:phosphopentomutase [Dielma fastidiosa]PXX80104.1 phosphopentomutase [Dielma fastidiosa]RHN01050.1 phosphopentomutase [Dielma fastidiosa]
MNQRFVVIVLDGFGIGAMSDAATARPGDESSSTLGSILNDYPDLKLPALERLGLMNAFGKTSKNMHFSKEANFGKCELMHFGADTFMGHQEIMGTLPKVPKVQPFQDKVDEVAEHLLSLGHKVDVISRGKLRYLLVDDACTVADNIDADFGMAYNCTAPLDVMPFEKELELARQVREVVTVNRVIPFGGTGNTIKDILAAEETREDRFIGIHAVKSKSYEQGYMCRHLGYGVDKSVQAPTILSEAGIEVTLLGKVADIVANDDGKSISCVDTGEVLDLTLDAVKSMKHGFICTNVQETDLAGHSQDAKWYMELLKLADAKIAQIIELLNDEDVLVVMADHGNDPDIGHNKHTRENVPLLVWHGQVHGVELGLRKSLSDVGASVCDFFGVAAPQNGSSFMGLLKQK